jgi:hypothetical protein
MKTSIPTIALSWLLASSAVPAQALAAHETVPASAPAPAAPLNLSLSGAPVAPPPAPATDTVAMPAAIAPPAAHFDTSTPEGEFPLLPIDLALRSSSEEVRRVARWVTRTGDNTGLPFVLIDKANARVYSYSPAGVLQAAAPVLLGMAKGDRLIAPNSAAMSEMPPQSRITPAGRFVSRLAIDSDGKELLVLDYDASISLHPVVKGTPEEHRAARLKSLSSDDNRISFGCVNAPPGFYTNFISAPFKHTKGIVYVLPEMGPASALFGFDPDESSVPGTPQPAAAMNASPVATVPDSAPAASAPVPVAN